ncbi:MAG TPA: hypothetical protein VJ837_04860 [Candidatus Paceibacterota bacterium]|nr:hypothetical protein [Candidatus Paceibacterota bacterium]
MSTFSLAAVREIWGSYLKFLPTAMASFDHITVGFPSRIMIGYRRLAHFCTTHTLDEFRAVSVVLDNILPVREVPCGVSAELGILPNDKTMWVANPHAFYFNNSFLFAFEATREEFKKRLSVALHGTKKELRFLRYRDAMGWYELIASLWDNAEDCRGVLAARRDLLSFLGARPKAKQVLHSSLFSVEAEVLESVTRCGFDLGRCPFVEKAGIVRIVNEDGTEGNTIYSWDQSIPSLLRERRAVPSAPIAILATSLAFPNFGNDYGMRQAIAEWLGVAHDLPVSWGDGKNSWPVGVLRSARSKEVLHSLWADLLYWGSRGRYLAQVECALERGREAYDLRLCDWQ